MWKWAASVGAEIILAEDRREKSQALGLRTPVIYDGP